MNAGKSTTLLQSSHNYQERGMDTLLFCPQVDDRYGTGKISTRIGLQAEAITFASDMDLFDYSKQAIASNPNIACVLVDEAQFMTKEQVEQICRIADELNLPVLCYGIRSDFKGEPFPGSLYLLVWADALIEIKTICHCGRKASMNMRVDDNGMAIREGNQVEIGGNERYISTCRRHFKLGQGERKKDQLELSLQQ